VEDLDRQILKRLTADGRMSYTDLGRATGLSTSAVHQRVRKLEERGAILGYTTNIDATAIGLPLTAFIAITPRPTMRRSGSRRCRRSRPATP